MEYRVGNSKKVKSKGDTYSLICPKCKKLSEFGVFSNFKRELTAEFPPIDYSTVYFLVCPNCAEIFTVDEAVAKEFAKGAREAITEKDLKQLKPFKC